jgi:hypothetical protein
MADIQTVQRLFLYMVLLADYVIMAFSLRLAITGFSEGGVEPNGTTN